MYKIVRNSLFLAAVLGFASCKNGGIFKKKPEKSDVTGWNYNDKNQAVITFLKLKM
jgi:hypothetical protein